MTRSDQEQRDEVRREERRLRPRTYCLEVDLLRPMPRAHAALVARMTADGFEKLVSEGLDVYIKQSATADEVRATLEEALDLRHVLVQVRDNAR